MEISVNYDQIAARLINDNLLLTALELHLELIESGRELSRLKEFFSNPGNFEKQAAQLGERATSIARSQSQATLDSLDISRFSEDEGERGAVDERVAVLEFELRKAREFNEYLLRQGYRLTAVTFSEENENQDFEDWDDVGLNVPRPPELTRMYREAARLSCVPRDSKGSQTELAWKPELPALTSVQCQTTELLLYSMLNSVPHCVSVNNDVLSEVTELLPKILQSLPSNRKEELIPLIAVSARLHGDQEQVSKLVALLLNLRKRPQENERKAIVAGLCDLASNAGVVESHLLPQTCSALAPLTSDLLRKSQLLPLLQTLLIEAQEDEIKISVIQNLSILMLHISDPDKYQQCEELCFLTVKDQSIAVQTIAIQYLLPVLAQWALNINKLETHLLTRLMSNLSALINDPACIHLINAMISTLPYLFTYVSEHSPHDRIESTNRNDLSPLFQNLNDPHCFHNENTKSVIYSLSTVLNGNYQSWGELDWVKSKMIPQLYEISCSLTVDSTETVTAFVKLFHFLCKGFGKKFTQTYVKPLFMNGLKNFEDAASNLVHRPELASVVIIPVLLVSVLTTGDPEDTKELADTLRHLLVSLPACNLPTFPLKVSVPHLCRAAALQETVLSAVLDTSKHSRAVVRLSAAQLLLACLPSLQPLESCMDSVLPALAILSNDTDPDVKEVAVALCSTTPDVSGNTLCSRVHQSNQENGLGFGSRWFFIRRHASSSQ
ncbi:hypothetical protein B566_EDAN016227 [Ephemera danica]|nr:hypothetical protein B566_EDAN016227 [Ephemera danica]